MHNRIAQILMLKELSLTSDHMYYLEEKAKALLRKEQTALQMYILAGGRKQIQQRSAKAHFSTR